MNGKNLLVTLTFVIIALLTWQLRWVLLIFFGAIVASVCLDVLIQKLQSQLPLPRTIALLIVLSLLLLSGTIIFLLLVPELITQVKELGNLIPTFVAKIKSIISNEPRLIVIQDSIPEQFTWDRLQPLGSKLIGFAGGAANSFIQFLLISLLAILLALDPYSHRKIIISATPKPYRKIISELLNDCRVALGGWLTGMTISATSIFFLTWAGLTLLKVPLALLSAIVCGSLTFLPTIGPTAATLLPLGLALIISPGLMFQVLILRIILQNLEAFLLTPLLLSRTVNLLPSVALMSQISLGALLGLPGVLLALPLAVVLQVGVEKIIIKQVMDAWI